MSRIERTLLVAALLAAGSPASAAPPSDPDPDTEVAQRHFLAAQRAYEARDYDLALREFDGARRAKPHPALDFNIGRCLDRLERYRDAVDAYQRYLDAVPTASDAGEVRQRVAELKRRFAAAPGLTVPPPGVPAPRRQLSLTAPVVVLVLAIALAGTASGLIGSVASSYDDLDRTCRPCTHDRVDPLVAETNASYALFAAAGVAAVVDVVLWAIALRRQHESGIRAAAWR